MVTLRLTKMEVQELKLWGNVYKIAQEETGVNWEEDQERLMKKLCNSLDSNMEV